MAIEKAFARICAEPGREERTGHVQLAALVTNMSVAMGTMRVVRVCSDGSLDLLPGRRKLPILRERHCMISREPKIIAVVRGQAVHQHRDLALLSDATGAANQAVRVCGTGDYQRVSRP